MVEPQYQQTGHKSNIRICPRHGDSLALSLLSATTVDSKQSFIAWHCEHCAAFWHEVYFVRQAERELEPAGKRFNLYLRCPSCASARIRHACEPGCCEGHYCEACNAGFEVNVEVLVHGTVKQESNRYEYYPVGRVQGFGIHAIMSGFQRTGARHSCRTCPKHRNQIELVILNEGNGVGRPLATHERLGWYCDECQLAYMELGSFNSHDSLFTAEGYPGIECPVCHGFYIDTLEASKDGARVQCIDCKSELRILYKGIVHRQMC